MKNKYIIIKSLKLSEKDKNNSKKISARFARHYLLPFPLKTHAQPHGGQILTSKLKKSLQISMHLGGKDINVGFGRGRKILILCKIYTPERKWKNNL